MGEQVERRGKISLVSPPPKKCSPRPIRFDLILIQPLTSPQTAMETAPVDQHILALDAAFDR